MRVELSDWEDGPGRACPAGGVPEDRTPLSDAIVRGTKQELPLRKRARAAFSRVRENYRHKRSEAKWSPDLSPDLGLTISWRDIHLLRNVQK